MTTLLLMTDSALLSERQESGVWGKEGDEKDRIRERERRKFHLVMILKISSIKNKT